MAEKTCDRHLLLANGKTGEHQQPDGNQRQPAEVAVTQRPSVTEAEKRQIEPWQSLHRKSLCKFVEGLSTRVGAWGQVKVKGETGAAHKPMVNPFTCGSWLASDEACSADIFIDWSTAIAGKPAPTGFCVCLGINAS
ncbi:hypothetical protein D3C81_1620810 [compost metagenome]